MVDRLIRTRDRADFQDMSMEFARHINVMTPRMESVADELRRNGIGCGVALFGETIIRRWLIRRRSRRFWTCSGGTGMP